MAVPPPGRYKAADWASHEAQTSTWHSATASASVPASRFLPSLPWIKGCELRDEMTLSSSTAFGHGVYHSDRKLSEGEGLFLLGGRRSW